ncbi:Omp28-related outer membrane protein, partial [Flavobacteriaceae bacterium]|nr:Omp28-related outer membrane protein [Flavobacteriaceae bacterium]MDC1493170.1 Omp28-related outer membrane protein [Flavobacteriaceae bacterium]
IHCTYCPDGHEIAQSLKDANPDNVFIINIHTGGYATPSSGEPDFRTSFGEAIANQSNLTGYPSGSVNRQYFSSLSMNGGTAMGRGGWSSATSQVLNQSAYVNLGVEASINVQNNELTVHVEGYYTGDSPQSTNLLNVVLTQNNTLGPQTGGGMGSNYNHMHRLVHMITGQWGFEISNTSSGSFVDETFTYTIPSDYNGVDVNLSELNVIAFISETQQNIISGAEYTPTFDGLEYSNDAAILGIEENLNGNCGDSASAVVVIQNSGYDMITNFSIEYSINNGNTQSHNWSGSLGSLESISIELPAINYSPYDTNSINITISDDDNNQNNSNDFYFNQSSSYDTAMVTLNLVTDNYASETSWQLTDSSGYIITQNESLSNASTYSTEIEIPTSDECYTFTINDTYGDGICCAYGVGSYSITDDSGNTIISGGEFSSVDTSTFRVGETLGINSVFENDLNIFPNPSNGVFTIKTSLNNSTYKIYNLIGQHVKSGLINNGANLIDLRNSIDGIYFMTIERENGEKTGYKLIKN